MEDKKIHFDLNTLRELCTEGRRVRLVHMAEDPRPIEDGMTGTVMYVDDIGQVHVHWDNGRLLAINPEVDSFDVMY